jgi:hypothetical protein
MVVRPRIYRAALLHSEGMYIYSTDLYQGVNIPIFGNPCIARIVRAGGPPEAKVPPPPPALRSEVRSLSFFSSVQISPF